MLDIGFLEMCIVFIVGLMVLGPDKMPSAVRQVGQWIRVVRRTLRDWSSEVNRQLDNDALQRSVKQELQLSQLTGLTEDLKQTHTSVNTALGATPAPGAESTPPAITPGQPTKLPTSNTA